MTYKLIYSKKSNSNICVQLFDCKDLLDLHKEIEKFCSLVCLYKDEILEIKEVA
jgi:hypothetical protein